MLTLSKHTLIEGDSLHLLDKDSVLSCDVILLFSIQELCLQLHLETRGCLWSLLIDSLVDFIQSLEMQLVLLKQLAGIHAYNLVDL